MHTGTSANMLCVRGCFSSLAFTYPMVVHRWVNVMNHFSYVEARNITLSENTEEVPDIGTGQMMVICKNWEATFSGSAHDGSIAFKFYGPHIEMIRTGRTAQEAYKNLVDALTDEGWTVL